MNLPNFGVLLVESLVLLAVGVALVSYFIRGKYADRIKYIFAYTYSLKIIVGTIIVRIITSEYGSSFLSIDTQRAAQVAENISQAGILSYSHYVPYGLDWIPYYYAVIFNLTGSNSIYVMAVWSLVASLTVIPTYILAKSLFSEGVSYISSILVLIYPSFFVLSFVPHKDVLSTFLLSLSALSLIRSKLSTDNILLFSLTILGLLTVRPEMIIVLIVSYILWRVLVSKRRLYTSSITWSILVVSIALCLTYAVLPATYAGSMFSLEGVYARLEDISNVGSGGGGIQESIIQQNIFIRTLLGSVFLLIKPFPPTETLTGLDLSTFLTPSAFAIYLILPFVLYGVWTSVKRRGDETFLIFLAVLTFIAAAAITGGAAVRYRVQVMPFLLIFASYGYCLPGNKKPLFLGYYLLFVLGVILYILLKAVAIFKNRNGDLLSCIAIPNI